MPEGTSNSVAYNNKILGKPWVLSLVATLKDYREVQLLWSKVFLPCTLPKLSLETEQQESANKLQELQKKKKNNNLSCLLGINWHETHLFMKVPDLVKCMGHLW